MIEKVTLTASAAIHILPGLLLFFFGSSFVFGFILYILSRVTRNLYLLAGVPRADIFVTGWIGTPVHELGHLFFCLLFGHSITSFKLFQYKSGEGSLGYVQHAYNSKNLYHQIGNFFIGAGPVYSAAVALWLLMYFVIPSPQQLFPYISFSYDFTSYPPSSVFSGLVTNFFGIVQQLLTTQNINDYRFWLFLYPAMSVASHAGLSPSDIRQMLTGFFFLVLFIFILLCVLFLVQVSPISIQNFSREMIFMLNRLLVFAVFISLINFALTYCVLAVIHLVTKRKILNLF